MSVQVKQLKSYLGASVMSRVLAWVLLGVCLVCAVLAISTGAENGNDDIATAAEFYPSDPNQKGEYVWVDVVGLSDWVYDVGDGEDVYYLVMDNYGYSYVASMNKSQFNALRPQFDWFSSDGSHPAFNDALGTAEGAEEFYPGESALEGSFVWVNAIGVSDWVYSMDGRVYYVVVDEMGYGYVAQMSEAQFAQLGELYDWFMTEEDVPAPAPVYLTGVSTEMPQDVAEAFCEVWGYESVQDVYNALGYYFMDMTLNPAADGTVTTPMPAAVRSYGISKSLPDDVADAFAEVFSYESAAEVREHLGDYYLDMTAKPSDDFVGGMFFLSMVSGIASLCVFLTAGRRQSTMKKCVKRLQQLGLLEDAALQLNDADIEILGGDYVRLSRDYLFCRRTGAVVAYGDIMWSYLHVTRRNFVVTGQTLLGFTAAYKNLPLCDAGSARKGGGSDMLNRVMQVIYEKNPAVLLGYNGQNAKAYRDRVAMLKNGSAQ